MTWHLPGYFALLAITRWQPGTVSELNKESVKMRRNNHSVPFHGISVFLIAALMGTNPVLAADRTISVSGDSVGSDCAAAKSPSAAIKLSGDLEGCLATFVQHFNCRALNGFDFSVELGREEFEGTLEGKSIKFDTLYTFNAVWPQGSCPTPAPEAEVAGGCTHFISGEGIQGVIRFYDIIPTVGKGASNFFYEGVLTVSDDGSATIAPLVQPSLEVAALARGAGAGPMPGRPVSSAC